jgi:hypothetical protein
MIIVQANLNLQDQIAAELSKQAQNVDVMIKHGSP